MYDCYMAQHLHFAPYRKKAAKEGNRNRGPLNPFSVHATYMYLHPKNLHLFAQNPSSPISLGSPIWQKWPPLDLS
ncbi:hypothetical protein L1987_46370 [Smallanthus sonchifolius]|uniref:Uncharacterized protein n=1 Tax=Smallanthus sonchifolius TaxID=185202 RepID=A0ACB9FZL5_9ASTR|nr:hypothetical protein L1987_46370 [Smallanthus sonchifolius]